MVQRPQAATAEPPAHFEVDQDFCEHIPQIAALMLSRHATHKTWTPELGEELIDQYVKSLDPQKNTLLSSDVEDIRARLGEAFQRLKEGQCTDLTSINDRLLQRMGENTDFVKRFLGQKYKLDKKATVQTDTDIDQRSFAKTQEDKESVLSQGIHFQVAEYLRDGMSLARAKKKVAHAYELGAKHFSGRDFLELADVFLDSVGLALDPHTTYFSPAEMEEFEIRMKNSFEGIGASLGIKNRHPFIESLIPGGSAELGGQLKPGDRIIGVAQDGEKMVSTLDMELNDVVTMIRGPKGTQVTLTVRRKGKNGTNRLRIAIVRDEIKLEDRDASMKIEAIKIAGENGVEKQFKIATINLPSFYGESSEDPDAKSSARDVKQLLRQAREKNVDGLVIDLSRNPGGLLGDAVDLAGYFIQTGAIAKVGVSERRGLEVFEDTDKHVEFSGPVVINVSSWSMSASEIVAGALKAYDRAVVVGDKTTFGKGTVQIVYDEVSSGRSGAVKVTTSFFFVPDGHSTQHRGVASDIVIPSLGSYEEFGEKYYENSLVPPQINPFVSASANAALGHDRYEPITDEQRRELEGLSQLRVSQDKGFQKIEKLKQKEKETPDGTVRLEDYLREQGKKRADTDDDHVVDPDLQLNEAKRILVDLIQSQQRARQERAKESGISAP